ncbi:MAG TPA: hypothetical protein VK524_10510, partial [Polyangiaceae bacterium]|nr:hypothetical protein [Polyangiaceae bacterium]
NQFEVWSVPALAPGETATMTRTAYNPRPDHVVRLSWNDFGLPFSSSLESVDLNPDNDVAELDLGLASDGIADLEVQSAELYPGPTPEQRILRVTIANRGPTATRADSETPLVFSRSDFEVDSVTAPDSDWRCERFDYPGLCYRTAPLASGSTATFELLVRPYDVETMRPWVAVDSTTVDPDKRNNVRYFSFQD